MTLRTLCTVSVASVVALCLLPYIHVEAADRLVVVPDDYATIQEAINNAEFGDTIFVKRGTYYESLVVNKTVSLLGEDQQGTIINGGGPGGRVIEVTADNVTVANFTVTNRGAYQRGYYGIMLSNVSGVEISHNMIDHNTQNIWLSYSSKNTIFENRITDGFHGIRLDVSVNNAISENTIVGGGDVWLNYLSDGNTMSGNYIAAVDNGIVLCSDFNIIIQNTISSNNFFGIGVCASKNMIYENTIAYNAIGMRIFGSAYNNSVFHNDFVENQQNAEVNYDYGTPLGNRWDDGYYSGGNRWSSYTGVDLFWTISQNEPGSDGIGDVPYFLDLNNSDTYPLMGSFTTYSLDSNCSIQVVSSSTISDFGFNGTAISFNVSGGNGVDGFCRLCIPTALMNGTYRVFVNGTEILYKQIPCPDDTYNYLYFNYTHSSEEVIVIPELRFLFVPSLFTVTALIAAVIRKKLHTLSTS